MPRTGGVYTPPAGTKGVPNTTIQSVPYNTLIDDLTADANAPRPVTAGGTGATSASGARTALGVEIGANVQAYDAGLQSIAGLVTVGNQMLYTTALDVYATTSLTPFARDLLGDVSAAAMKTRLGLVALASSGSASDITSGTLSDARLPSTLTGKTFINSIIVGGEVTATGSGFVVQSDGNRHLWFRTAAGINRALVYSETADNSIRFNLHNTSGTFVRTMSFRESDGLLTVQGPISNGTNSIQGGDITASRGNGGGVVFLGGGSRYLYYNGSQYEMPGANLLIGSALYQTDGNIIFAGGMASGYGVSLAAALSNKVTVGGEAGSARFLKQGGASSGTNMVFNWSGQGGQPSWLWGGNDGTNQYVYNPSNFSVNWANGAYNADVVDGYHATDLAQIYKGTNINETNFPIGTIIAAGTSTGFNRNSVQGLCIYTGDGAQYTIAGYPGAGSGLAGTWTSRGCSGQSGGGGIWTLFQRIS